MQTHTRTHAYPRLTRMNEGEAAGEGALHLMCGLGGDDGDVVGIIAGEIGVVLVLFYVCVGCVCVCVCVYA